MGTRHLQAFLFSLILGVMSAAPPAAFAGGGIASPSYTSTDIRYSYTLSRICSGPCGGVGVHQLSFSTMVVAGDLIMLGGDASQPGLYQVLAVDGDDGRWITVSPRPQTATDQALNVTIGKLGPLPADLTRTLIREVATRMVAPQAPIIGRAQQ